MANNRMDICALGRARTTRRFGIVSERHGRATRAFSLSLTACQFLTPMGAVSQTFRTAREQPARTAAAKQCA